VNIDAHSITPNLWVGSAPPPGNYAGKFDSIVLVAEEYQPGPEHFPGVTLHRHPFDDTPAPTRKDLHAASEASKAAAFDLASGKRVLVTCRMGRNRSGFVAALALRRLGMSGKDAYQLVRSRRVDPTGVKALGNLTFARILEKI